MNGRGQHLDADLIFANVGFGDLEKQVLPIRWRDKSGRSGGIDAND